MNHYRFQKKPTTNSRELSGMPPKNPSGNTTEMEGRILQMHQIMKKTWDESDSITAVIEIKWFSCNVDTALT